MYSFTQADRAIEDINARIAELEKKRSQVKSIISLDVATTRAVYVHVNVSYYAPFLLCEYMFTCTYIFVPLSSNQYMSACDNESYWLSHSCIGVFVCVCVHLLSVRFVPRPTIDRGPWELATICSRSACIFQWGGWFSLCSFL